MLISHRGLDIGFSQCQENSLEAFEYCIKHAFSFEFDLCFSRDRHLMVFHDATLRRISRNTIETAVNLWDAEDLKKQFGIPYLSEIFNIIPNNVNSKQCLHIKGGFQTSRDLDQIMKFLGMHQEKLPNILIFDLKPDIARIFWQNFPQLDLAPSVAHPYDIARFAQYTSNTLFELDAVLENEIFSYIWLDEWDLINVEGGFKNLYTANIIEKIRNQGKKVAIISPELHSEAPGHTASQGHQANSDFKSLETYMKQIISLAPELICTDYPSHYARLISEAKHQTGT